MIQHLSCAQEMCLTHQISCVQEMCMKCHLSCSYILIYTRKFLHKIEGNVLEMSCVLVTGHVPGMSCVLAQKMCLKFCPIATVPGKVKEMSKFPGVGNVYTMNKKCKLCCTFHGISLPRKFRISSNDVINFVKCR